MKKQYIIPIFVPHLGCPNDCVFCNQQSISGQKKPMTVKEAQKTIEMYLEDIDYAHNNVEIAFFGGSFTAIDVNLQEDLLKLAYSYTKQKKVKSIRISTRPDYINRQVLKRLKKYKVKIIELGVQSANDYILNKSKRGHTFEDVKKASRLIKLYGFTLGHQIMVGLPESTKIDEINTVKEIIKLRPKIVRIYPVLVVKGTQLEKDYLAGKYQALTVVQAVETCKEIAVMFGKKKIQIIRIGLQGTEEISDPTSDKSEIVAGPYHPAFRQLVEAGLWYDVMLAKIKKLNAKVKEVVIHINPVDVNNVIGHKKENAIKLKEIYDVDLIIEQSDKIKQGKSKITITKLY